MCPAASKQQLGWTVGPAPQFGPQGTSAILALAKATQAAGSRHGEGKGTKPCGPMAMMEENRPLGCSEPPQQPADGWRANGM